MQEGGRPGHGGGDGAAGAATSSFDVAVTVDVDRQAVRVAAEIEEDLAGLVTLPPEAAALQAWIPHLVLDEVGITFEPLANAFGVYATAGEAGSTEPSAQVFLGSVHLTPAPHDGTVPFVVGLTVASAIDLGATPLFGSLLAGVTISDLRVSYASHAIPAGAVVLPPPAPATQPAFPAGFSLELTLAAGGAQERFVLTPASPAAPAAVPDRAGRAGRAGRPGEPGDGPAPDPPVLWFSLGKAFGPLTVDRVGIVSGAPAEGSPPRVGLVLDASLELSSLAVALRGFAVTFPQDRIAVDAVRVALDALDVAFSSGSLELAGSLARSRTSDVVRYDGSLTIRAGRYGIAAVGSFAELQGAPSLFVFGVAEGPFGGPPAFYVTGLAAGFGLRRGLRLPPPDRVQEFPFLVAAAGRLPDPSPDGALAALDEGGWVPPEAGSYWVAAGVQFTSFQLLHGVAMLTVQLADELVVALLGMADLRLPATGHAYAAVGLTLSAVLRPSEGTFQATALLTPDSWVVDPACHLTGGFAFFLWFGDSEHAGDVVVTLGGYNPLFTPPPWYPSVPRLGIDWKVSEELRVTGGAYFAVTPSCAMAGGELSASYTSGELRAWFVAHADFILYWSPLWFDAAVGVSVGVSYTVSLGFIRKTFATELSADVELWGPPVVGVAHVRWWVISFTVDINGGGRPPRRPGTLADWPTFVATFLPAPAPAPATATATATGAGALPASTVCRPRVAAGLLGTVDDGGLEVWVVQPGELVLATETVVPATSAVVAGPTADRDTTFAGPAAGVYPLGSVGLLSTHRLRVVPVVGGTPGPTAVDLTSWRWAPVSGRLPGSLWGRRNDGRPALAADLVPAVVGLEGTPPAPATTGPGPVPVDVLGVTDLPARPLPLPPASTPPWPVRPPVPPPPADARAVVAATVASGPVAAARQAAVDALVAAGIGASLTAGRLAGLAEEVGATFPSPPRLALLGERPPAAAAPAGPVAPTAAPAPPRDRPPARARAAGPWLVAAVQRATRPRPGAHWTAGPHTAARTVAIDGRARAGARAAALRLLGGAGDGAVALPPGTTLVWDVPLGPLAVDVGGGGPVRVTVLDDQDRVLDDRVAGAGGPVRHRLPDGAARVATTAVEPVQLAGAAGWVGPAGLVQVAPQALLAEGAVVRPQSPLRLGADRDGRDVGPTTGRAMVARNRTATGTGTEAGWVATTFAAPCATVVVLLRQDGDDRERPELARVTAGGGRRLVLRDVGTADDGARLVLDVAGGPAAVRVLATAPRGWSIDGVVGLPAAARDAGDGVGAVRWPAAAAPAATAGHGPATVAWR